MSERNHTLHNDDWLERALRDEGRAHAAAYIPDDGFSARVMQSLPGRVTLPAWRKPALVLMWTAAAAAGATALPDTVAGVAREAFRLIAQPSALPQIAAGVLALGAALWSAAAWMLREE